MFQIVFQQRSSQLWKRSTPSLPRAKAADRSTSRNPRLVEAPRVPVALLLQLSEPSLPLVGPVSVARPRPPSHPVDRLLAVRPPPHLAPRASTASSRNDTKQSAHCRPGTQAPVIVIVPHPHHTRAHFAPILSTLALILAITAITAPNMSLTFPAKLYHANITCS